MSKKATKLVIITEKLLLKHLVKIIDAAGATGYTVTGADGQGSRDPSFSKLPSVSDSYEKIKLEVITIDEALARKIADEIAASYFENFCGIIFMDQVNVLCAHSL